MPEKNRSNAIAPGAASNPPEGAPICFVTEDGATVTITLDPTRAGSDPMDALVKAKDAIRCLADAFGRAERRVAARPDRDAAVFRSWAYRP